MKTSHLDILIHNQVKSYSKTEMLHDGEQIDDPATANRLDMPTVFPSVQ